MGLLKELYQNRRLILNLAINDFKTKYAGSYLGITWAFVQPIMTILIFWFVFEVGFRSLPVGDFPFILWLITGLVPWFFFSEAIINGTYSFIEYSYLVKKVVFKVSIIPLVKVLSSFFIHIFFVVFMIVIFFIYRVYMDIYFIQILYYMFCLFLLVLSLSYINSSIVIFFKDWGPIVNIVTQFCMWLTPIMWKFDMIPDEYQWIFKLNPIFYIVGGYRDTFINKIWFWEKYNQTLYFWIIITLFFTIGTVIFKRLKPHFPDML